MADLMQKLSDLREQEVIEDIDFELCRFLNQQEPDVSEEVLLAGCLLSYLYRQGDVCLILERYAGQQVFEEDLETNGVPAPDLERWIEALSQSDFVGTPGDFKPLILDGSGRLYLHKLWHYEKIMADHLLEKSQRSASQIDVSVLKDGLERMFKDGEEPVDWQKVAAANAVKNKLTIISGGPGTGKTSTVVRIMALLMEQVKSADKKIRIALAAPTGKAAARLKDSILSAKGELDISEDIRQAIPDEALTLHQLLGARRNTSAFRHDEENPMPYDVVVVDEASMVDHVLMSKLMQALLEDTKLILLGDKDQLASVEAGAVLGDICDVEENSFSSETAAWLEKLAINLPLSYIKKPPQKLTDNIILLTKSYRFGAKSGIGRLASSINAGDSEQALEILKSPDFKDVSLIADENKSAFENILEENIIGYIQAIRQSRSVEEALSAFEEFRILSAHRRGPQGVENLNRLIEHFLQEQHLIPKYVQWYPGKPVIINTNLYSLGLHNGDTGVCLPDNSGDLKVCFRDEGKIWSIAPSRLPDYSAAYALTVHKSQGSEFEKVFLMLPNVPSKILTRELLYTAITRARTSITVFGSELVLRNGISKELRRFSGLRDRLWD